MKYAVEMGSGAMIKHWFRHSKVDGGGNSQTHRQEGDLISLLLCIQNKESELKVLGQPLTRQRIEPRILWRGA
jgi:hypothetical protein